MPENLNHQPEPALPPVEEGFDDPVAYRDVSTRLPNEALREELEGMTPEEQEAYLHYLQELSDRYLGPGGP